MKEEKKKEAKEEAPKKMHVTPRVCWFAAFEALALSQIITISLRPRFIKVVFLLVPYKFFGNFSVLAPTQP